MTIAAPFVAFIILHNEPLQPFLALAENRHPMPLIEFLALARFDIFYLGLVVIGMGVGAFTLFSPAQTSKNGGYEEYVLFKERTKTQNGVAGSLRLTLDTFLADTKVGAIKLDDYGGTARFPRRFREGLHSLLEITERELSGNDVVGLETDNKATEELLVALQNRGANDRRVWQQAYRQIINHSVDVFRLEYLCADYSSPRVRAAIFWTLIVGTMIVLLPTLITTFLVVTDLIAVTEANLDPAVVPVVSGQ